MICEKHSDCEDCRTRESAMLAKHEQEMSDAGGQIIDILGRDRELVERLEEQAKWWKRHHPDWNETETEVYEECADTILAALAARNEGNAK